MNSISGGTHSRWAGPGAEVVVPIQGMHVTVVCLREGGIKHRSVPAEGWLASEEVTNHTHMSFMSRTVLSLYRTADRQHGTLLKPLFDAQLLQWDSRGIFMQGWDIGLDEAGHPMQQIQIWCISPAT